MTTDEQLGSGPWLIVHRDDRECGPVVTHCKDNAERWASEGHAVVPINMAITAPDLLEACEVAEEAIGHSLLAIDEQCDKDIGDTLHAAWKVLDAAIAAAKNRGAS